MKFLLPNSIWNWIKKKLHFLRTNIYSVEAHFISNWAEERLQRESFVSDTKNKMEYGINLVGYLSKDNGLGEAARSLSRAIETTDIPLKLIDYPGDHSARTLGNGKQKNNFPDELFHNINLLHINPPQLPYLWNYFAKDELCEKYNIGIWYWELLKLPEIWHDRFQVLDEIWVASKFVYESINSVSPIPVYVVPPSINVSIARTLSRSDFGIPEDKFVFLCSFDTLSVSGRKNPQGAIDAFKLAFDKRDQSVFLVIKINNAREDENLVKKIKMDLSGYQNYLIIEKSFSKIEFNTLISLTDAYISLHRSEGFGLIPAEAMFLGKPVIMTKWSGNLDFMTDDNCCGVDYKMIEVGENAIYDSKQTWADPNIEEAAEYMVKVKNDIAFSKSIGAHAARTIREMYSEEVVGELISKRVEMIAQRLNSK